MELHQCPTCGRDGYTTYEIKDGCCPSCQEDIKYCCKCGEEMEWKECWNCGGKGGRDWEDLQFEDPLWYSPDDFVECDECNGVGGFWICTNDKCK
jgi:hypothetical protein